MSFRLINNLFALCILAFGLMGCFHIKRDVKGEGTMHPKWLEEFLKEHNYRLVYPAVEKIEPGEIRRWDHKKGLWPVPVAYKEQCFSSLGPRENKVSFQTLQITQSGGIEFILGLNNQLIPYEAELKGQFGEEVGAEIVGDIWDAQEVSELDLEACIKGLAEPCKAKVREEGNVIVAQVLKPSKFTFKFKGLKTGGIDFILAKLLKVGFSAQKKNEETLEFSTPTPMVIAHCSYIYKKEALSPLKSVKVSQPALEVVEFDETSRRIAGPPNP